MYVRSKKQKMNYKQRIDVSWHCEDFYQSIVKKFLIDFIFLILSVLDKISVKYVEQVSRCEVSYILVIYFLLKFLKQILENIREKSKKQAGKFFRVVNAHTCRTDEKYRRIVVKFIIMLRVCAIQKSLRTSFRKENANRSYRSGIFLSYH